MRRVIAGLGLVVVLSTLLVAGEPGSGVSTAARTSEWWLSESPVIVAPPVKSGRKLGFGVPVSKRMVLSPDVQVLKSGRQDSDRSLVAGVRMKIAF